jgi:hypothetical protein
MKKIAYILLLGVIFSCKQNVENFDKVKIEDSIYSKVLYSKRYIPTKEVDSIAKLGKKAFINYYFSEAGCIKSDVMHGKNYFTTPAVVKQLFEWEIPCVQDSQTGCVVIAGNRKQYY